MGDQVFSSFTNFGLNILIVRSLGASTFGAFSLAFSMFVIAINISRALTSEPLVVRSSGVPREEWARSVARASGLSVVLGVVIGALCVLAAQFMTGDLRAAFIGVGVCMPGLLLQDLWRFAFFASGKGQQSLLNDLVWAMIMFPILVVLLRGENSSLLSIVLVWGGAATVAGLLGIVQARVIPSLTSLRVWIREHRDLTPSYMGEMVTGSVFSQVTLFGIGAVASLAAVGAYRSAFVVFGPIRMLYQGLGLMGVPEAVRILNRRSAAYLGKSALRVGAALAIVAATFGLLLALMPDRFGEKVMGSVWFDVVPLILPFTIGVVGLGLTMPVFIGMRALEAARRSFWTKLTVASMDMVASITGASFGGALGAAWAGRPTILFGAGLWWRQFRSELARREETESQHEQEVLRGQ